MANTPLEHPNAELLRSATKGFDFLFSNDIVSAREHFKKHDDPFHMMGLGVCAFLEAALGMETALMTEATRCLAISEAGARKQTRVPKPRDLEYNGRFHHGLEWEILNADAVVLLGLTHALSESYMGYLQCMYSLNSAHSKFTKLFKTVFPNGLPQVPFDPKPTDAFLSLPANLKHKDSDLSLASAASSISSATPANKVAPAPAVKSGFFSRWVSTASTPTLPLETAPIAPDGPVEDLIVAGTAFGFGLFNLVFSLLPKKVQGVVGLLGFKHDRKLALQALALAAMKYDVHGTFAGLVLMTYHGVVLLTSGYQANEDKIMQEYQSIVDRIAGRYPEGALWILNRAKIMRMAYEADIAISILQEGLEASKNHSFAQADTLLIFELAWTLLAQMRYQEAADAFLKITELNSWSHGTYYFLAAGCYFSLGNLEKTQSLFDAIPDLIDKKKINGKDLPTEVLIKKKLAFYKEKQRRLTGSEAKFVQAIRISPAEEMGIFWNNHSRISPAISQAHIDILTSLTPPVFISKISSPASAASPASTKSRKSTLPQSLSNLRLGEDDLDTPDELAVRALLLGIHHRTKQCFEEARAFLDEAAGYQSRITVSTWVAGIAEFERAVVDLKEAQVMTGERVIGYGSGPVSAQAADKGSEVSVCTTSTSDSTATGLSIDADKANEGAANSCPPPMSPAEKKRYWTEVLKSADARLEVALGLATSTVDLSSRLDSRIVMLRDEIATKRDMMGIAH